MIASEPTALAGFLARVMAALLVDARRWLLLAARSGVGARSEDEVRRVLAPLAAEGWRLRDSLAVPAATGRRVSVERAYRERRPAAGLLGVLDQSFKRFFGIH